MGRTVDDFERDEDGDGTPDGWYNIRDAGLVKDDGPIGPTFLRQVNDRPGRPARASRAFATDGRQIEALHVRCLVRLNAIRFGERAFEGPQLTIDFFDEQLRQVGRQGLGPWSAQSGSGWFSAGRRIWVPPTARDAILTVGLLGATGTMDLDGLRVEALPRGGRLTDNLILNGDFEEGDPEPVHWLLNGSARRVVPGHRSPSALRLEREGAWAMIGLASRPQDLAQLSIQVQARGRRLTRRSPGAVLRAYFVDDLGQIQPDLPQGRVLTAWTGSFTWSERDARLEIPFGARRVLLQFAMEGPGTFEIDDVRVRVPQELIAARTARWRPGQVEAGASTWHPYEPSGLIVPDGPLDASRWLRPLDESGRLRVESGRLVDAQGRPVRLWGVSLMPPWAVAEPAEVDALAERLARSGFNLARINAWDVPLGPGRSLIDDARADTRALDPLARERFNHLVAALQSRGIRVSLDGLHYRKFRTQDGLPETDQLGFGGGSVAAFSPVVADRVVESMEDLLGRDNPELGQPLWDHPGLAYLTLAVEKSLADLSDESDLSPVYQQRLEAIRAAPTSKERIDDLVPETDPGESDPGSAPTEDRTVATRRSIPEVERAHWVGLANRLREEGLKAPIASVTHWRREPGWWLDLLSDQAFDLIEDRLFWSFGPWMASERRSLLWDGQADWLGQLERKRDPSKPYVLGEFTIDASPAWASPFEGADLWLLSAAMRARSWDGLVKRGVSQYPSPEQWGQRATGTGGSGDVETVAGSVGGNPQVIAVLPHLAAYFLADPPDREDRAGRSRRIPGWDPRRGRLRIDTPRTQGLIGWWGDVGPVRLSSVVLEVDNAFAIVLVTALDGTGLQDARRVLVTAVGRFVPNDLRWSGQWRRVPADPGRPGFLQEPIGFKLLWTGSRPITVLALDNAGEVVETVPTTEEPSGVGFQIRPNQNHLHWELRIR